MDKEVRLRIADLAGMQTQLLRLGAVFERETMYTDTYFKQPDAEVLKISEAVDGSFLVHIKPSEVGFEYLQNERIYDSAKRKSELADKYGVKAVVDRRVKYYRFRQYWVQINIIDGAGNFLVMTGPELTPDKATELLHLKDPELVNVPFDELPRSFW